MKEITLEDSIIDFNAVASCRKHWRQELEAKRRELRFKFDATQYKRPDLKWYQTAFVEHFTFLYDMSVYDPQNNCYQVEKLIKKGKQEFGGYDFLILWQAYPRIGMDDRNQFDFYRDMPGGLEGLRNFVDRAHACGVRVFIVYNPWDTGTRSEPKSDNEALAEIIDIIDADGIFLDTMHNTDMQLREALDKKKYGVVFDPEGTPSPIQGQICTGSWIQGGSIPPPRKALTLKWVEPRFSMRGVDRSSAKRTALIALGFFQGMGHVVWENIFGWWNPFSAEDRTLIRRCNQLLHAYSNAFIDRNWQPYTNTLVKGVVAHCWHNDERTVYTLFNTNYHAWNGPVINIPAKKNMKIYDVWNGHKAKTSIGLHGTLTINLTIDQLCCSCIVIQPKDWPPPAFADVKPSTDKSSCHRTRPEAHLPLSVAPSKPAVISGMPKDMVLVSAGQFVMKVNDVSGAPEGGCYSYINRKGHPERRLEMKGFLIDKTPVTNAQYKEFLNVSNYRPRIMKNFLKHWIKPGGENSDPHLWQLPPRKENHPVVYVDLDDARAYARWAKKRLPTEEEWQYAAQGTDGRKWPWGNKYDSDRCNGSDGTVPNGETIKSSFGKTTPVDAYPGGASPFGCLDMSGNVWEWTESERDDGHTRYAILRGGSCFRAGGSRWYVSGGAQPCDRHAKMLLLYPSLDRCSTIGFRGVKDLKA